MASDSHWPVTIFLRCNIATIRQMFHRLVIHVIQVHQPSTLITKKRPFNLNPLFSGKSPAFSIDSNVQKLRPGDSAQYLLPWLPADQDNFPDEGQRAKIGSRSPITRYWLISFTVLLSEKKLIQG